MSILSKTALSSVSSSGFSFRAATHTDTINTLHAIHYAAEETILSPSPHSRRGGSNARGGCAGVRQNW